MAKRLRSWVAAINFAVLLALAGCVPQVVAPAVTPQVPAPVSPSAFAPRNTPAATPTSPQPGSTAWMVAATPSSPTLPPPPFPTPPPQPLVPTVVPDLATGPAVDPLPATVPPHAPAELAPLTSGSLRSRLGVGWPRNQVPVEPSVPKQLGFGWYLDWGAQTEPLRSHGVQFVQMISAGSRSAFWSRKDHVAAAIRANPGAVWFLGNEPDVPWQDNRTPEEYAQIYHQFTIYIKSLDPTARVGIAGVSQPTPLRMLYLERVLAAYERFFGKAMPIDVWNVHGFILREERDSWGVSIPPGFDRVTQGVLYEIEDHDDLEIFKQQIIDFRRWMARKGLRDKPLVVSEYGVLMPAEYGFPPQRVAAFMQGSLDFLLEARDTEIGYGADDNRLVQGLAWFSVADKLYSTGNLIEPSSGKLTLIGQAFANYAAQLDAQSGGAASTKSRYLDTEE